MPPFIISAYFNSIKVRLKQALTILAELFIQYFNSIKVRLKQTKNQRYKHSYKFQFHKGTIKTRARAINPTLRSISIP